MITKNLKEDLRIILKKRFLNKNISEDLLIKSIKELISINIISKDISIILEDFREEIIDIAKQDFLTIKNIKGRGSSFIFKIDERGINKFSDQFIVLFEAILGESEIII